MRVFAVDRPERQCFDIYYEASNDGGIRRYMTLIHADGGNSSFPRIVEVVPGGEAPRYIPSIPYEVAGALAEAIAPRPHATERHLDDAIEVRDRMVAMIERVIARVP